MIKKCSFLILLAVTAPAYGQRDAKGSSDHPVITRYPGSTIRYYDQKEFDKYSLVLAIEKGQPGGVKDIEGKVTKITYTNPAGRSSHEIFTNYQAALTKAGYQKIFACDGPDCGYAIGWQRLNGLYASGGGRNVKFLTVRGKTGGQDVTVALSVNTGISMIHVIEHKAMESGLVTASAADLADGIERDGHISVYAIYFDTGKATLKAESAPALIEIAKLMQSKPALRLHVVGHTDNTGGLAMNMKLSAERATSVLKALTGEHGVSAARLEAHGVGPLAPVATNLTDEGRTKNRRVDLVSQ